MVAVTTLFWEFGGIPVGNQNSVFDGSRRAMMLKTTPQHGKLCFRFLKQTLGSLCMIYEILVTRDLEVLLLSRNVAVPFSSFICAG